MSDFKFLESMPADNESGLGGVCTPVTFSLPDGSDLDEVAAGLSALNSDCRCEVGEGNTLTVFVPPSVRIGDQPFDVRHLAYVLKGVADKDELSLGTLEACCGDGRDSCCRNI